MRPLSGLVYIFGDLKMNSIRSFFNSAWFSVAILAAGSLLVSAAHTPLRAQTATPSDVSVNSTFSRNVYSVGGSVRPSASVEGDFVAAGGRVIIDQPVKGDATLAGGSVDVRAPIGDDVRVAGGDVTIESTIGGELYAAAGNITLTKAAQVAYSASLFAGNVTIDGKIDGPVKVGAQKIILNGEIKGDTRLYAQQIELSPSAKIGGALHYPMSAEFKKADGATIGGSITRENPEDVRRNGNPNYNREWRMNMQGGSPMWTGGIFMFLAILAFASVFLLLFPKFSTQASGLVKTSPWLAMAIGFGSLVGVPMLAVLLFITILGIPLGVAFIALYPALLLAGYVVGVLFLAQRAQAAIRKDSPSSFAMTIGFFALALVLVMFIAWLPFIGPLTVFAITIVGVGACVLGLYRRHQSGSSSSAAPPRSSATTPASGSVVGA
jgi:cytoskeletal protein CcmA (bactofilin family)